MSLEKIAGQLKGIESKIPPVELWDPPYCGEMGLTIKADGQWFYQGSIFKRMALVKLLASVLKKEQDEYFLVTPVEKIKITVEDVPFVITQWQENEQGEIIVATQTDDEFVLGDEHQLKLHDDGQVYASVRRNLWGRVHRNVYYQWIDHAEHINEKEQTSLVLKSGACSFVIGRFDNDQV